MKILNLNALTSMGLGIFSVIASSGALPASAATIITGAGGGSGFVSNSYDPSAEINRFFDTPVSTLSNLGYFQLSGLTDVNSASVGSQGATSSSSVSSLQGTAAASIQFAKNDLALKTQAKGTISTLGFALSTFTGETAVGFAVSALKDTPTISSLTATGSGAYQLLFDLTGGGARVNANVPTKGQVSLDAFGALAVRNNGTLFAPSSNLRIAGPQQISTMLMPMTFGQAFNLDIAFVSALSALCLSPNGCAGNFGAEADFANTLTLTGVNVFDAAQNKVDSFTFTSDSGLAYIGSSETEPEPESVPEPLGLGGILAMSAVIMAQSVKRAKQSSLGIGDFI